MGRALGANALLNGAFETTIGTAATSGYHRLPFVSHTLGEERPLLSSDLLGLGREPQDPTYDVATNQGDLVVPVDVRNFWYWLKLFMGAPVSTSGTGGEEVHTFTSGALSLPTMSLEVGNPDVPNYSTHRGVRGNTLKIEMARSGLLSATLGLIAIGETASATASAAGTPTTLATTRFAQAAGYVKKDGAALGSVVKSSFTYSNQLEPVETIQTDGRIEDSNLGMVMMSGTLSVLFKDLTLLTLATNGTPCELDFGWTLAPHSLVFANPRVFLPLKKKPISGPKGIQVDFDWQASGATGASVTATLTNDQVSYT